MTVCEANTRAVTHELTDLAGVTSITYWCHSFVKRFRLWNRWQLWNRSRNIRSVMSLMAL